MTSSMNMANGSKTARACDICITKSALYYCASDDAFLCHTCDYSVHSANPLARRHQRVLLKTIATCNKYSSKASTNRNLNCVPSWQWHRGFTKKPRTPRHGKHYSTITTTTTKARKQLCLVPEVGDTNSHEENGEEQVLYRVPNLVGALEVESQRKVLLGCDYDGVECESLNGFVSSDIELAADIESLLGKGLKEDQCMGMEELGLVDCKEEGSSGECCVGSGKVKVEEENQVEMGRELAFELRSFDNDDSTCEKVGLDVTKDVKNCGGNNNHNQAKRKILLQLDYEAVITAWESKRSPWTTADKPDFLTDHYMVGSYGMGLHQAYGELFGCDGDPTIADGEREARVSRYREKRQTRLFSKKIRYEVRKLNAEKRPRIKGRFVKRATFAAVAPSLNK